MIGSPFGQSSPPFRRTSLAVFSLPSIPSAYAGAGLGPWPKIVDQLQDFPEQVPWHRHLDHLEGDVPAMADHLRTDLHEFLPKRGQQPVRYLLRQGQSPLMAKSGPSEPPPGMSALPPKADVLSLPRGCLLMTLSGH